MSNIFKFSHKDTRAASGNSTVNFKHFAIYSTVNIAEFKQINDDWAWKIVVSGNTFVFNDCEKCTVLWAGKNCWAASLIFIHLTQWRELHLVL